MNYLSLVNKFGGQKKVYILVLSLDCREDHINKNRLVSLLQVKKHFPQKLDFGGPDVPKSLFTMKKRFFEKLRLLRIPPTRRKGLGVKKTILEKMMTAKRIKGWISDTFRKVEGILHRKNVQTFLKCKW